MILSLQDILIGSLFIYKKWNKIELLEIRLNNVDQEIFWYNHSGKIN